MKKCLMNWAGCGAVALLTIMTARAEVLLFDLGDVKLSGEAGANTFYAGGGAYGTLASSDGDLQFSWTATANQSTYFLSYFEKQTLTVGQSLKLDYTVTPSSAAIFSSSGNGFRFGLYDSKDNTKLTADLAAPNLNDDSLKKYQGYIAQLSAQTGNGNGAYVRKNTEVGNPFTSANNFSGTTSPTLKGPATAGVEWNGSLMFTRTADGLLLENYIGGVLAQSGEFLIPTTAAYFTDSFDTLAFFVYTGNGATPSLTFSNLSITLIPEPSVTFLLATGGGILLALMAARCKRRCGC
ncbi:MAG: PEP-CTERM sorting domain-containing protein [Verrucomicrobiales bacterium]|jgi:hypothetical protein|nr:PEP-CTERM sorting domain-containing protein [Verrucomicrobiales bacterium]